MIDLRHPTPQFRRDRILSLDGTWMVNGQPLLVPYPPQAPASGWQGPVPEELHYERRFSLPEGFLKPGERLLLHFGAVDQAAYVFVNGMPAAMHEGGYLPFETDITERLQAGENLLQVVAVDPLSHDLPWGKQSLKPKGMWYTPVSGIWQSVWLEAVPARRIRSLRVTPEDTAIVLRVEADLPEAEVTVRDPAGETAAFRVKTGREERLTIPRPHRWTPEDPFLYELSLRAGEDRVESYFALRTVGFGEDARGIRRLLLNGEPVFLCGLLDQGYFPEGIFTPAAPEDYAHEMRRLKELGFNCDRKHIKLEPEAFYTACDMAGVLVIQDMVNSGGYNWFFDTALPNLGLQRRPDRLPGIKKRRTFFEEHCGDTVRRLWNHPCIIGYTLFNEGWGQYDTDRIYGQMKALDPTRFWDSTSGWFRGHASDVDSRHVYFRNRTLKPGTLPMLLSECGGYARAVEGHASRTGKEFGYGAEGTEQALTDRFEALIREMVLPAIPGGLFGYVYTQLTDVETEINGLYTYDRAVCKADAERLGRLNAACRQALAEAVLPTEKPLPG